MKGHVAVRTSQDRIILLIGTRAWPTPVFYAVIMNDRSMASIGILRIHSEGIVAEIFMVMTVRKVRL